MSKAASKKAIKQPAKPVNPTPGSNSGAPGFNGLVAAFLVVIALATWVAYSGALDNKFVSWDDQIYVSENPFLLKPTPENGEKLKQVIISNNFHPLTMWSLFQNVKAGGMNPGPIIKTNIVLHILNAFLVCFFIGFLSRGRWLVAGFTALIFALHPMHVESVAWVSERKDVLYVFFAMLSLLAYLKYLRKGYNIGWLALALGLFALSCLSKAMAVVVPLLFLLLDHWEGRSWSNARVWLEKAPFFALSLLFGLIAMDVQKGGNFHGWFDNVEIRNAIAANTVFSPFEKLKFAGYGLGQYILKLFAPVNLTTYYPYPSDLDKNNPQYLLGALALVAYLGLSVWAYVKKWHKLFFGLAWGFITLMLVLQFISVGTVIMADRYTYLPYIGWAFVLCLYLYDWAGEARKNFVSAALGLACLAFAWASAKQVEVWQDSISLWSRVIDIYPNDSAAYSKRGNAWGKERNDLAKAQADFETAMKLNPKDSYPYEGLGIVSGMQNNHAKALEMFTKCIELQPGYHNFYFNRGLAYLQNKMPEAAVKDFEQAITLHKAKYDLYLPPYLDALLLSGQLDKAKVKADEAIQMGLRQTSVYLTRAQVYLRAQHIQAARADVQEALKIDPNNVFAKQLAQQVGI